MKKYEATKQGKAIFVKEVLSPLLYQADTGWHGAEYAEKDGLELVWLLTPCNHKAQAVNITGDSLEAIIRDVFKNL